MFSRKKERTFSHGQATHSFMGTPAFALPSLQLLHEQQYPIIGVVSQPDRPQGRGLKEVAPPVKILAQNSACRSFSPKK